MAQGPFLSAASRRGCGRAGGGRRASAGVARGRGVGSARAVRGRKLARRAATAPALDGLRRWPAGGRREDALRGLRCFRREGVRRTLRRGRGSEGGHRVSPAVQDMLEVGLILNTITRMGTQNLHDGRGLPNVPGRELWEPPPPALGGSEDPLLHLTQDTLHQNKILRYQEGQVGELLGEVSSLRSQQRSELLRPRPFP